jgi:hypothetical protein
MSGYARQKFARSHRQSPKHRRPNRTREVRGFESPHHVRQAMDGFEAYHALDCGGGEIVSISLMRDQAAAQESDERAREFVRRELADFDIERTEVIGGEVVVSRAMATLLEPAHA